MKPVKKLIRTLVPARAAKSLENTYRLSRGLFWQVRYGFPAKGMRVIAVTGTNGKSTTCAYINEILKAAGYKTAMITTPMMEIAGKQYPRTTTRTLEKQSEVQDFFFRAKKADVDWAVLETPSHALDQHRIMGVKIEIAVITNLSPEHLDYHKTMENYARAKSLLLKDYGVKLAVLNTDNEWYEYFKKQSLAEVLSVGKGKDSGIRIKSVKLSSSGSEAKIQTNEAILNIKTALLGEFNLYNAAQAAAAGLALNIEPKKIIVGIENLKAVSGRMEPVEAGQKFRVLIDYAITPDAIEKSLKALQSITKGKVRIVFGATGHRDREKRPLMGEAAGKYADVIYLTDDETYNEKSEDIISAVYAGIKKVKATKKTKIIPDDRGKAIELALKEAGADDVVYITGLGHETARNMGGKLVPWSDADVARKYLELEKAE